MSGYRLTPLALEDIESIGDHIAGDNPARAVFFVDDLLGLCARIAERPRAFRRRNDLAAGLRQAVHGNYLLLFTFEGENVVIERVVHGARRLEDLI